MGTREYAAADREVVAMTDHTLLIWPIACATVAVAIAMLSNIAFGPVSTGQAARTTLIWILVGLSAGFALAFLPKHQGSSAAHALGVGLQSLERTAPWIAATAMVGLVGYFVVQLAKEMQGAFLTLAKIMVPIAGALGLLVFADHGNLLLIVFLAIVGGLGWLIFALQDKLFHIANRKLDMQDRMIEGGMKPIGRDNASRPLNIIEGEVIRQNKFLPRSNSGNRNPLTEWRKKS